MDKLRIRGGRTLQGTVDISGAKNAALPGNQLQALRGVERINSDHLCWYSPFTTLKLLRRGGYVAEALWAAQIAPAGSVAGRLLSALVARRPLWADNLVVVARVADAASAAQPR